MSAFNLVYIRHQQSRKKAYFFLLCLYFILLFWSKTLIAIFKKKEVVLYLFCLFSNFHYKWFSARIIISFFELTVISVKLFLKILFPEKFSFLRIFISVYYKIRKNRGRNKSILGDNPALARESELRCCARPFYRITLAGHWRVLETAALLRSYSSQASVHFKRKSNAITLPISHIIASQASAPTPNYATLPTTKKAYLMSCIFQIPL